MTVDGGGRPIHYHVGTRRAEPAPVSPVNVAEEQALAVAKAHFAKRPKAIVRQMEVVSLSTRSFYAPEGEPVYVVRTRGKDDTGRPGLLRYRTWVIDRGVHATTGELLVTQTFPEEYYWRGSEPRHEAKHGHQPTGP
jgi:hypothetical protein